MNDDQFRSPSAEFRPVAMWFLNGELDEGELARQLAAMAAGGVGGVQVAARTGLETPYLSQRWFELIGLIIAEAHRHGLAVWLADEYPYPSGASGGEVILRHPEFRAWQMRATHVAAHAGQQVRVEHPGTMGLQTCAVPLRGGLPSWNEVINLDDHVGLWQRDQVLVQPTSVYLTTRRYMSNSPRPVLQWRVPETDAEWQIWLIAAAEIADYKFFGSYVDLCNPDATRFFLETTHQRYLERLNPGQFGQLAGFFVDESHPQNWSWRLPDYFRARNGYDLLEVLPAVWTSTGPDTATIRYDYWQTMTELFVESFHKPVADWCRQHGVQLSLEVPSTRNVVQRFADVPGIDPGHDKVGVPLDEILDRELTNYRGNLTFPASLAAQTGRQRVLDELFHSVGWSLTLQDMKAMLDRAAARGANLFAFHAFCYTIGGLRKWDAPPSEFEQNPYWPHFGLLSAYAGRLGYALSRGRRVANIAVLDPVGTLWSHQDAAGVRDEVARGVVAKWAVILRELTAAQRPHDTIDPLLLAEATVADGVLCVGDARYQVVVVVAPPASRESGAARKLEEFAASGGTVIAAADTLIGVLDEVLPADLRITPPSRDYLVAQRRDGDEDIYFIANSGMEATSCEIALRGRGHIFDLESGEIHPLTSNRLEFTPYGAHLLVVRPGATPAVTQTPRRVVDVDLEDEWHCQAEDDNTLRLDRFSFSLDASESVVVEPKPLINVFQDLGGRWPGELEAPPIFGALPRIQLKLPALARYSTHFDVEHLPSRVVLCIEDLALAGRWAVWLNDAAIPQQRFVYKRRWDIGNREVDVRHLLQVGTNELRIEVQVAEMTDGLLDAVYLLGDFGVYHQSSGACLAPPPQKLRYADRHTHGYPYYAGTLHLKKLVSLPTTGTPLRLRLPDRELMFMGVAQLSVNGRPLGVRAWTPYAWDIDAGGEVELTLSVTNTLVEQLEGKRYDPLTRRVVPIVDTGGT